MSDVLSHKHRKNSLSCHVEFWARIMFCIAGIYPENAMDGYNLFLHDLPLVAFWYVHLERGKPSLFTTGVAMVKHHWYAYHLGQRLVFQMPWVLDLSFKIPLFLLSFSSLLHLCPPKIRNVNHSQHLVFFIFLSTFIFRSKLVLSLPSLWGLLKC